jgi:formylmethanofuran dehydrogenase subunit A
MLLIDDPWRVHLTTDHPNGGCFWRYPEIIKLLMDAEFRKEQIKHISPRAQKRIVLADLDREYSLYEVAIVTSAGPARALGLPNKGQLGPGADADVTIYPAAPDGKGLLFSYPRYVIKGGEIVVEEGDVKHVMHGKEFIVQPSFEEGTEAYLKPLFEAAYTMSFANYPVEMERVKGADIRKLG